jgi:hypothetical protein
MVNVKIYFKIFLILYLLILYCNYSIINYRNTAFSIYEKNKLEFNIKENKKIDVFILGGSNAIRSISVKQLKDKYKFNFYNLSINAEGYDSKAYFKYIDFITQNCNKNDIKIVFYSTLTIYDAENIDTLKNLLGEMKTFTLIPDENILEILWNLNKKEEEIWKYNIANENINYPIDLNNKYNLPEFNKININSVSKKLFKKINKIKEIFPKAYIVIIAPKIYTENEKSQIDYINKLKYLFKKKGIIIISLKPTNNRKILPDGIHATKEGKQIIMNELIDSINANVYLSNVLH